jgi:clan AA aspartic protease (TIGR02281 family)
VKNRAGVRFDLQISRGIFQTLLAAFRQRLFRNGLFRNGLFKKGLFEGRCLLAILLSLAPQLVQAGYLDENPEEVFSSVYERLGALPLRAARDPFVWLRLEELKREPCDQKSVGDLALMLDQLGYRREAADGLYRFFQSCGAPLSALPRSIGIYLKLTDYEKAVEVADEYIRRAPTDHNARYLRGVALEGVKDFKRALIDYADTIELFPDKKAIGSQVFTRMAGAYAALGQFCEAAAPINMWVSLDVANRDTSRTQKMIDDYETRGNCVSPKQFQKERFPLRGQKNVVTVKVEINGVQGVFVLDTGASYLSMKSTFADRAKVPQADASEITLTTANGLAKAKLSKADKVRLGKLEATNVPVAVQKLDEKSYGPGVDGLLGMSFLSRFEVQMADGFVEIRTRGQKKIVGRQSCASVSQRAGDPTPDLILDFGCRRARNGDRGTFALLARRDQAQDPDFAIGVIEIAPAVAPRDGEADAGYLIFGVDHAGGFEIACDRGSLGINVGGDMMRDRAGIVADADAAIEGGVAEPHRAILGAFVENLPEADMMTMVGAAADRLLKSEILMPAEIIKFADRRGPVRAIQQYAADDFDRRFECHGIGRIPARRLHRAQNVLVVADQADIDRVAGNALRRSCHHRQARQALLVLVMGPEGREQKVGHEAIADHDQQRQLRGSP